jgi:hypothetical protein
MGTLADHELGRVNVADNTPATCTAPAQTMLPVTSISRPSVETDGAVAIVGARAAQTAFRSIPFVPAKAGTQWRRSEELPCGPWIPACAGMNGICSSFGFGPRDAPLVGFGL